MVLKVFRGRRGTMIMLKIMLAMMAFLAISAMIEPIKTTTAQSRSVLDCLNTSLSTGESMTCIVVDSFLPIWVLAGLGVALAFLGIRNKVNEEI